MAAAFDSGAFQNDAFEVGAGGATSIDLTTASMGVTAQVVQARLAVSIAPAALATSAQSIQTRLAANLTAASQPMSGQSISTTAVARLAVAAMGFAAQAIDLVRSTAINLTAATMRFVANPITVTGAIAAVVGSWIIQSRRRRR